MMQMERSEYNRYLFLIGAIWNWAIAVALTAISLIDEDQLEMLSDDIPANFLYFHILMALVFAFGIGYYWVSLDFDKNRDLVKAGIIAKVLVFVIAIAYLINGDANLTGLGAPLGDLIFAALFLETLLRTE
ncbi:MAG: hypothetical protein ACE5OZ_17800 [Candidatus Heimdallarchaeota archaeon]